jgi:transposase, IS30 family
MKYHQLTYEERYLIARLRKHRISIPQIARVLGRHRSTIWREVHRNRTNAGRYQVTIAQQKTNGRRRRSRRNRQFTDAEFAKVIARLKEEWSPEQIANRLKNSGILSISHETIYQYIWCDKAIGGNLYKYLRCATKQRRKRSQAYDSRGRIAGKRMIDTRPKIVDTRRNKGHWEIDTVMGSGDLHCIVTIVERKTGYVLIGKLKNRTMEKTNQRTIKLIKKHGFKFSTITADNGTEFHTYEDVEKATGTKYYFAHPYHSWERGTNENTNGLIRQYLPKRTSMAHVTQHQCNAIARKLNTRPRKRHNYRTPEEMMYART